jgi:hypothetical protein
MGQISSSLHAGASSLPPLSSIAERRSNSIEDTDDEEDPVEGGWKTADVQAKARGSIDESVIKAGYLWKKGERRKVEISLDSFSLEVFTGIFRHGRNAGLFYVLPT